MTSDPFKLVTERRFQELREEARGGRLVRDSRTESKPRRRDALVSLVNALLTRARSRKHQVPTDIDIYDMTGVTATQGGLPERVVGRLQNGRRLR